MNGIYTYLLLTLLLILPGQLVGQVLGLNEYAIKNIVSLGSQKYEADLLIQTNKVFELHCGMLLLDKEELAKRDSSILQTKMDTNKHVYQNLFLCSVEEVSLPNGVTIHSYKNKGYPVWKIESSPNRTTLGETIKLRIYFSCLNEKLLPPVWRCDFKGKLVNGRQGILKYERELVFQVITGGTVVYNTKNCGNCSSQHDSIENTITTGRMQKSTIIDFESMEAEDRKVSLKLKFSKTEEGRKVDIVKKIKASLAKKIRIYNSKANKKCVDESPIENTLILKVDSITDYIYGLVYESKPLDTTQVVSGEFTLISLEKDRGVSSLNGVIKLRVVSVDRSSREVNIEFKKETNLKYHGDIKRFLDMYCE